MKLLQIKLDSFGNKNTAILQDKQDIISLPVENVINLIKSGQIIERAVIINNELCYEVKQMSTFDDLSQTTFGD